MFIESICCCITVKSPINFLNAGSSKPPMEVFKIAGVDMTSTQPIADAFEVLREYIDRLENLTK